jgi:uncharacterized protein (DUF1684 family)
MESVTRLRREKDRHFRESPASPLRPEQRDGFTGLDYYAFDPALVFDARLNVDVPRDQVRLAATHDGERVYTRAGRVELRMAGDAVSLDLFNAEGSPTLFLPFRDATSGTETYGAGRYIDVEAPRDGVVRIDFNLAYNPYCAYNDRYTCPLPPVENWLAVPVRAGERTFRPVIPQGASSAGM